MPYVRWPVEETLQVTSAKHVYRSTDPTTGQAVIVKVWFGWRRGESLQSDLALMRLLRGVLTLQQSRRPDLPQYTDSGLSGIGAFVVCLASDGRPWGEVPTDGAAALRCCLALVHAIAGLHDMDLNHGDLAPRNVLMLDESNVALIDLFDYSGVGDGMVRAGEMRPDNAELLTPRELDRYAVTSMVRDCLASFVDFDALLEDIGRDLKREGIETLKPLAERLAREIQAWTTPSRPTIAVHIARQPAGLFAERGTPLYARAFERPGGGVEYVVFGPDRELGIRLRTAGGPTTRIDPSTFKDLSIASDAGLLLDVDVMVTDDARVGVDELLSLLRDKAPVVPLDRSKRALPESANAALSDLDVAAYWQRLLALEEEHQPTVLITGELNEAGNAATYSYERVGLDFDFDPEDQVEVRLPGGGRIGDLDVARTDASVITVRHAHHRRLVVGDRVTLAERRNRASFDRRQKAVERILNGEAAIEGLIAYFTPQADVAAIDYGIEVPDAELDLRGRWPDSDSD